MEKVKNIELPFFMGFYESSLTPYDILSSEYDNNVWYYEDVFGKGVTADDLDVEYDRYKDYVGRQFVDGFEYEMKCTYFDFIGSMTLAFIDSPREYNFRTDKVFANVEFADDWKERVKTFMEENRGFVTKRISEDWTSCSGFVSFMPNTYAEWYDEFCKDEVDERFVGSMLGYMLENELEEPMWRLTDYVVERLNIIEFVVDGREREVSVVWDTDDGNGNEDDDDLGLPDIVRIPNDLEEDDIADWLSDTYGFCVESFVVE